MKKQITILCCVLSAIFLFAGCSKKETEIPLCDREQIESNVDTVIDQIVCNLPDKEGDLPEYYDSTYYYDQSHLDRKQWAAKQESLTSQHDLTFKSQSVYDKAIELYEKALLDSGKATARAKDIEIGFGKDGGYEATVMLFCEQKNVEMALSYNTEMEITNAAFNVQYTIGENLKKAALNTLLGMGTVFVILILISLIISLFGFIPKIEKALSKSKNQKAEEKAKVTPAPAPAAAPVAVAEEDLSDDLELVAVISAAIAAYEGSEDTSGYVVRSIHRVNKRQRA